MLHLDTKRELLTYLQSFISKNKKSKFETNIENRTRFLTIVLEDIYQSHNASAVLRTCDCFGVQDIHIIENRNTYTVNPDVALGSSKWLTLKNFNRLKDNTEECLLNLKQQGYTLVATTPHNDEYLLQDLPMDGKVALLFGTELEGLSEKAIEMADRFVKIPMYGFTESFNISVSAALCMFYLTEKLRKSDVNWMLSQHEKIDIMLNWTRKVIKRVDLLENEFFNSRQTS
ncbi:MAG: RNA methyltransferase [Bacteroidales bacterium]|nr:RNA methyltransferase [Bacteroidales bacterium]